MAATAILLASTLGCGDTVNRSSVLSPTQNPPAQPAGAHGLVAGTYEGTIPSIRISYNGGPFIHTTRIVLRQDGQNVAGQWLEIGVGGDDTGGAVTGTFDSPPSDQQTFGRLTLALTSADFAVRVEAKVTTADGSMFIGSAGECTDSTCATFWPDGERDNVTFTRTGQ